MSETAVVEKITETNAMLRVLNRGLMVAWINAELFARYPNDVNKSLVFYDADKMFVTAIPGYYEHPPHPELLATLYETHGVRYWSKGIV